MPDTDLPRLWDTIAVQHVDPDLGDVAPDWEELPENTRAAITQLVQSFTGTGEYAVTAGLADQVFIHQNVATGEWYWHRIAANNEIISDGEGYESKSGGVTGAHRANPDLPEVNFHVEGTGA